jgi:hypothetical protein
VKHRLRSSIVGSLPSDESFSDVLMKTKKSIRENQVIFEQQMLIIDSIEVQASAPDSVDHLNSNFNNNVHDTSMSNSSSSSTACFDSSIPIVPVVSISLAASLKSMRRDTVKFIQAKLAYIDEFDKQVHEFEKFLSFLQSQPNNEQQQFPTWKIENKQNTKPS